MNRWPATSTRPCASWGQGFGVWARAAMGMIALSVVWGITVLAASALIGWLWFNYTNVSALEGIAIILFMSPIISAPVLLVSAPVVVWAVVAGRAGWAVALAWGAFIAPATFWVIEGFRWDPQFLGLGVTLGLVFAAMFWLCAKLFNTNILVAP